MAKLTLNDVSNLTGAESTAISTINSNSAAIEAALENTLSRDGTTPNQMGADIDMNSNDIINAGLVSTTELVVDGSDVSSLVQDAVDAVSEAAASATSAASSATSASTSASVATTKASEAAASAAAAAAVLDFDPATKADVGHTHTISDVTDLQTTLDGKAATSHTHAISNVTGLQTALDNKANNTVSIAAGTGLTGGGDLTTNRTISADIATLAEAQAGISSTKLMTPERTADAIAALGAGVEDPYKSADLTITSGGLLTLAHGLSATPNVISARLKCVTAEAGWSVDEEPTTALGWWDSGSRTTSVWADATNIYVKISTAASSMVIGHKTTTVPTALTNANWRLKLIAEVK